MKAPLLDKRDYEDIIEEMKRLVPNYTPEWNFDTNNPDVGSTLFMVFAMQLKETIDLLNRSLDKNFISFLNMSNVILKPTKSSVVPVVFTLTSDDVTVFMEKGTKLTCNVGENINFETKSDVELVPIKINTCFFASDKKDKIIKTDIHDINLFDYNTDNNLQIHELYIVEDKMFNIDGCTDIIIKFDYDTITSKEINMLHMLKNTSCLSWQYYAGDLEFVQFDEVSLDNNCIVLKKRNDIKFEVYEKYNSRTVRVVLNEKQISEYKNIIIENIKLQTVNEAICNDDYKIRTESLYNNYDKISDDSKLPFGIAYNISDYFYIGCDEVFTKYNSNVQIDMDISFVDNFNKKANSDNVKWKLIMKKSSFDVDVPPISSINDVEWHYFNGLRWEPLKTNIKSRKAFYCQLDDDELHELTKDINNQSGKVFDELSLKDKIKNRYDESIDKLKSKIDEEISSEKIDSDDELNFNKDDIDNDENTILNKKIRKVIHSTIEFVCPDDFQIANVCGQEGYFIRGEIKNIENNYEYNAVSMIPIINDLYLNYSYKDKFITAKQIFTINNNEEKNYTYELSDKLSNIKPFYGIESDDDVLYLCINKPIKNGPVNILFIIDKINDDVEFSRLKIEYLTLKNNEECWREISVKDETNGLTKTGIITLIGLNKFVYKNIFGTEGYWLKIKLLANKKANRVIRNIYFNGVWAEQQTTVEDEYLELNVETMQYKLFYTPILSIEMYVNEIKTLNKSEIDNILKLKDINCKAVYDDMGLMTEFWVQWQEVDTFINSGSNDRVYMVDRQTGQVLFGDNIKGKKPPIFNRSIKVNYKYGGGETGNVDANCINSLYESRAFIDKVFNPIGAVGGVDSESVSEAAIRATRTIRNKNKAISISDIENIILDNFKDIEDVKCISNKDESFNTKNGHVHIIILPKSNSKYIVSGVMKQRIYEFLEDKLPCELTHNHLHISNVKPIMINVDVTIKCSIKDDPYSIKMDVDKCLSEFLDFSNGNFNHRGWKIGEIPKKHSIFAAISKIKNIYTVEIKHMTVSYRDKSNINSIEISNSELDNIVNGIIISGNNNINIVVSDNY